MQGEHHVCALVDHSGISLLQMLVWIDIKVQADFMVAQFMANLFDY